MKTACLVAPFELEVVERDVPRPRDRQVRIRITDCGICGSDVNLWLGHAPEKLPMFLGHEVSGIVDVVGRDVSSVCVGDTVVVSLQGGAGFAEYVVADEACCVPVPPETPFAAIAEPLGCAVNAVEHAGPRLADDVVIVGGGFMATMIQMVTKLKGPRSLTVVSRSTSALDRALGIGATLALHPDQAPAAVHDLTAGAGADVVYEVTGASDRLLLAAELTRTSGTLSIAGYHESRNGTRTIPLAQWNVAALNIKNAHFRDHSVIMHGMRSAVRLIGAGLVDVTSLAPQWYGLADIAHAFRAATTRAPGFLKALVRP